MRIQSWVVAYLAVGCLTRSDIQDAVVVELESKRSVFHLPMLDGVPLRSSVASKGIVTNMSCWDRRSWDLVMIDWK